MGDYRYAYKNTDEIRQAALTAITTAAETTLTNAGTGGDVAIQAMTSTTPFGFVLAAEGEQVVETVLVNQARIAEIIVKLDDMEDRLQSLDLIE